MSARTTELAILDAISEDTLRVAVGSIVAVDKQNDVTTILLQCDTESSEDCGLIGLPLVLTSGSATFRYSSTVIASYTPKSTEIEKYTYDCRGLPTEAAKCSLTYTWMNFVSTPTKSYTSTNTWLSQVRVQDYNILTVTGGLNMLPAPTSTTSTGSDTGVTTVTVIVSPSGLSSAKSPSETAGEEMLLDQDATSGGSSSKVWIAGPVVGGLVGFGLMLILAWWVRRRRQKREIAAEGDADSHYPELEGKEVSDIVAEVAATERAVAELGTGGRSRDNVHEMPSTDSAIS